MTDQAKTMAEVLAEHRVGSYRVGSHAGIEHMPDIGVYESRCNACGSIAEAPTAHQAAALSAAGFGLVAEFSNRQMQLAALMAYDAVEASALQEAGAKALEDAAEDSRIRGDIGKDGGVEAWDYLRGRAAAVRGEDAHAHG